jgi:Secretion system C-terminal sorting domain
MKFILQITRKMGFLAFVLGVCLFSTQTAFSQVRTWDGGGDGTTWSDALNWSADVLPVASDSVIIIAGVNVQVASGTAVARKLGIYGTGTSQGKVTINSGATLNVNASTTGNVNPNHAVITLYGGMIDNKGSMTVTGRTNIDAIRFDNPTSGTLSSTYMGTGSLTCDNVTGQGTGSTWPGGANNGTSMTFAQTNGTATFTTSSSATYSFTLNTTGGSKSVFYCPTGNALIDGTGTIMTSGAIRSIRIIPTASANPHLTIGQNVTMNLSSDVSSVVIGIVLLSTSAASTSANMTNKGSLNFSGTSATLINSIYMENALAATNTTTFTNEGTIKINGAFATTTPTQADGGISMVTTSTGGGNSGFGNVFTNSGTIDFNTTMSGTSPKPLFYCTSAPKNLITNSGMITIGTFGTPTIGIRLGDLKTIVNNTGTITVGTGSITAGTANAVFNNNTSGILNLNSGVSSTNVEFFNTGGTFNVNANQRVGRLTVNNGTVAVADGMTFTTYALTLTSGHITLGTLGTGNVAIESGGNIGSGGVGIGSLASHIITNGTGRLTIQGVTTAGALFPIGQSASSYDPVVIKPATGPLSFGARVGLQTTALGTNPINPSLVVNREWDITGTTGTTDLSFTSSAANKDGSTTRPTAGVGIVGHYNSMTSAWDDYSAVYNSMLNTWGIAGYPGTFSPFIVASPGAVLSTELLNIKAKAANNTNIISWETASEINNKGFDVERQNANGTWASLGFVNGIGKAATYTFTDKGPLSISYYRLRQIDFDGKETLSKVVSVSQDTKGRISISPNPTSDKVNINLNQNDVSNQPTTVILSDMTGRQVLTQTTTSGAFQLDLSNLAKGMYVVTLQSNNAIYQEKIIRQ